MQEETQINLFIVYAREDIKALEDLHLHLTTIARKENLVIWSDGRILPGEHWDGSIKYHLEKSDIILLLISKYFFASRYIQEVELKAALGRYKSGQSEIIPVIVSPCIWEDDDYISQFQVLPTNANPIYSNSWKDPDEAIVNVVQGIKKVIFNIKYPAKSSLLNESFAKNAYEKALEGGLGYLKGLFFILIATIIIIEICKYNDRSTSLSATMPLQNYQLVDSTNLSSSPNEVKNKTPIDSFSIYLNEALVLISKKQYKFALFPLRNALNQDTSNANVKDAIHLMDNNMPQQAFSSIQKTLQKHLNNEK